MPDENSELVPWGLCLHNDSPSLAGRVDPSRLRFLHPRVSLEDCRRLRIPSVSQVNKMENVFVSNFNPSLCDSLCHRCAPDFFWFSKVLAPRTYHRFPVDDFDLCQAGKMYDLYDLYDLTLVAGWEPHSLHDLGQFPGLD